jgi:hypothetical protein
MFAVDIDWRIESRPLASTADGPRMTVTMRGSAASGEEEFDSRYLVGHVSLPVTVTMPVGSAFRLDAYAMPGFGWVRATDASLAGRPGVANTFTGSRATISAGANVYREGSAVALHIGAMRVAIDQARTVVGVGLAVFK